MRRISILAQVSAWVLLTGCADTRRETPTVPAAAGPVRLSLEVVEGETAVVPVEYHGLRPVHADLVLVPAYRTASAEDIVLMDRTRVPVEEGATGTIEFGLLALTDRVVEGVETLILRPVVGDGLEDFVRVQETEIEVVITDGPPACSGMDVRVGEPFVLREDEFYDSAIYTTEITIEAPESASVIKWSSPPDARLSWESGLIQVRRTRTLNDWRVEPLGDRVRHRMTAQWWSEASGDTPRLEMRVCGGPDYGKFIRCSPSGCAVHDEGS